MSINITYNTNPTNPSERVMEIAEAFGVGIDETHKHIIVENLNMPEFDVLYITGMSGSGKSSLLNALKQEHAFKEPEFDDNSDDTLVDTIGTTLEDALYLLNLVGLGEAFLYVKPYKMLSDGQKYRYRIAKLIESNQPVWCIDEFCSFLDRTTARIVSYNVQKIARKLGKKLIVATAHDDLGAYLQPDYTFDFGTGDGLITAKRGTELTNPFDKDIKVERGTIEDYKKLGKYHYKNTEAKFTKYIYKMTYKDKLIGVAVYSMPKQRLVGRNIYFEKKYIDERGVPRMSDVNRDFLAGARFIVHPMLRGIGLGRKLVQLTAPLVDIPYIEIVSVMSRFNKFLENAGCTYVCDNMSKEVKDKENKIKSLLNLYGFKYEFLASPKYCEKILQVIPDYMLKGTFYPALRANYTSNQARFAKYGISFQTKTDFFMLTLTPELLSWGKWATTSYYIWDNTKKES